MLLNRLKKFIVVTGHYGCGKTNFSINLAMDYVKSGHKVTLVDMDLVNPYFRTSDYRDILEEKGIEVIAPVFGHTNLDIPSLPAAMYSIFEKEDIVIVDVGGDDVGATVLGRFKPKFDGIDFDMLYLVNRFRNMTSSPEEAVEVLREIEAVSGLKATAVVNNSHMMGDTDEKILSEGKDFAEGVSKLTGLPLVANTLRKDLYEKESMLKAVNQDSECDVYPVEIFVKTAW